MKTQSTVAMLCCVLAASFLVTHSVRNANAEIPRQSKEGLHASASHSFIGTVHRTYERTEKREHSEYTYGVVEITVERVDKGKDFVAKDRVFVRYWQEKWTAGGSPPPGHYGHWDVPKERDVVEVYVKGDRTAGFDVLSPNGFFKVTKPKGKDTNPKQ